ncbi:MAG: glycoside hydrolase family 5 protein [Ruminococcus sp.]|nr:glycoside hydrolase family 5 protein [Ruminococcus sp.]
MKKNTIIPLVASAAVLASAAGGSVSAGQSENTQMRDITTMELVRDMGIGINLGNTYESCGDWIAQWGDGTVESYETAWGSPVITQKIIEGYADAGFGVLRVPVAWSNLMAEDYTISPDYIDAVREVVDWALDCDMYVIMNIHYDGGWFEKFPTDYENCLAKYSSIWTQLCDAFGDYGDYLMFESQNEELGNWSGLNTATSYDYVNEINQTFVDIVRSSGGNNSKRHLLIAGYNTDITKTCNSLFKMPEDPAGRCALSVHYYTPPTFAILEKDESWGKNRETWGTEYDFSELNRLMDKMKTNFVDKGIPVIIGEYGCPKKNKDEESVRLYLKSVCEAAYDRQMCPVLWDITNHHYNRNKCEMIDPVLHQQLLEVAGIELPEEMLYGDADSDGVVNSSDASKVLSEYALTATGGESILSDEQFTAADVNMDGVVDSSDASSILGYYAHISTGGSGDILEYLKA